MDVEHGQPTDAQPSEDELAVERPSRFLLLGVAAAAVALIAISVFTFLSDVDEAGESTPPAGDSAPGATSTVPIGGALGLAVGASDAPTPTATAATP